LKFISLSFNYYSNSTLYSNEFCYYSKFNSGTSCGFKINGYYIEGDFYVLNYITTLAKSEFSEIVYFIFPTSKRF